MALERDEQGVVAIGGESVRYEMRIVDARSVQQRAQDGQRGRPGGNIMVVVPGHGQSSHGPKKLVATAAQLSRSKLAWCIDPVPARGGDRIDAQAIAAVVRDRISTAFPAKGEPAAATLIGWSHGGSEALRAAEHDADLFPQFLGLCPTGFVDRRQRELLTSFFLEATRILWASARRRDWTCLKDTLRLGWNAGAGLVRDLWRGRSARWLVEDLGWAARKVTHGPLGYSGEVVLLFAAQDTVVRWHDLFPECERSQSIARSLAAYQQKTFPRARRVEVQVIAGNHVAPEVDAPTFLQTGLRLLGQLDDSALPTPDAGPPEGSRVIGRS
jgi:pimeloyl-ACP methyl ester carboxylesterase